MIYMRKYIKNLIVFARILILDILKKWLGVQRIVLGGVGKGNQLFC